jgi:broad specificity phosphatase PhoE
MPIILLIRHGENNFVGKRLAGRLSGVHLNDNGIKQAEAVANALCEAPIKAVYSSPLERAVQTAEPLAALLKLAVQIHPGLIEIDFGDWQGKTLKQLARTKLWKTVQHKPSEFCFPGGETFAAAQQRVWLPWKRSKLAAARKTWSPAFHTPIPSSWRSAITWPCRWMPSSASISKRLPSPPWRWAKAARS